jgi:putative endonuclease
MVKGSTSEKAKDKRTGRKSYYVYLLLCDDGSYYTGYTSNVTLRFEKHKKGWGARYTNMHRPKKVVYVEEFNTRAAAIQREQKIKSLSHRQKHELASTGSTGRTESSGS